MLCGRIHLVLRIKMWIHFHFKKHECDSCCIFCEHKYMEICEYEYEAEQDAKSNKDI